MIHRLVRVCLLSGSTIALMFFLSTCEESPTKVTADPDITLPEISILDRNNQSLVSGIETILVIASDNEGIDRIELWVDGTIKDTSNVVADTVSFHWDTQAYANYSIHRLEAVAYDLSGLQASDTLDIIVNNSDHIIVPTVILTIGDAINAASAGDTVVVLPGLYIENIDFNGKDIVIGSLMMVTGDTSYISTTIIDGNQNDSVVRFTNGESSKAGLVGLTLRNGLAQDGGGIFVAKADPTLRYLRIISNSAQISGGGATFYDSNSLIMNCWILQNTATGYHNKGGGIAISGGNISLSDVIINNNQGYDGGGLMLISAKFNITRVKLANNYANDGAGIYLRGQSTGIFRNVLMVYNSAVWEGGGILIAAYLDPPSRFENVTISRNKSNNVAGAGGVHLRDRSQAHFINSIIRDNDKFDPDGLGSISFIKEDGGELIIEYSNVGDIIGLYGLPNNQDGTWLEGNINTPYLFVDTFEDDFRLKSGSPCIDSGHPGSEYNDVNGSRNDMGAYGGPEGRW